MPTLRIALVPVSLLAISFIWITIANAAVIDTPTIPIDPVVATITPPQVTLPTTTSVTNSTSSTRIERREAIAEAVAEERIQLSLRAQERVTNLAANVSNRFEAAVNRLQNISDRLATRSIKLAATGLDISAATTALQAANADLARVRSSLAAIDLQVGNTVRSADVRTTWQSTREEFSTMRIGIVSAHGHLRTAIIALKNPTLPTTSTSTAAVIE